MELQYAFGNPRRKRKKSRVKARVAKRRKGSKLKKHSLPNPASKGKHMKRRKKIRRHKRRRNPETYYASKSTVTDVYGTPKTKKKGVPISGRYYKASEVEAAMAKAEGMKKHLTSESMISADPKAKNKLRKEVLAQLRKVTAMKANHDKGIARVKKMRDQGYDISAKDVAEIKKAKKATKKLTKRIKRAKGAAKMAKRKKKKKKAKAAKRVHRRKGKKKGHRKAKSHKPRRRRRKGKRSKMITHRHKRKGTKHYKRKTKVSGVLRGGKKRRRVKVRVTALLNPRRRRKHRRSPKHRHSRGTGHYHKGQRAHLSRIKAKFNPLGGPMDAQIQKYTGLSTEEMGSLALGGMFYSTVNGLVATYLPSTISSSLNSIPIVGPALIPILVGVGLKMGVDHIPNAQVAKAGDMLAEGLIGAAVVGLGVSFGQMLPFLNPAPAAVAAATPVSGVLYTPGMNGINYTPNGMSGVNYTPNGRMGIMPRLNGPQLGIMPHLAGPQLGNSADFGSADYGGGGGYTEAHNFSNADFGDDPSEYDEIDNNLGDMG